MSPHDEIIAILHEAHSTLAGDAPAAPIILQACEAIERIKPPILCCELHPMCEHVELDQAATSAIKIAHGLCKGFEGIAKRVMQQDIEDGVEVGQLTLNFHRAAQKLSYSLGEHGIVDESETKNYFP